MSKLATYFRFERASVIGTVYIRAPQQEPPDDVRRIFELDQTVSGVVLLRNVDERQCGEAWLTAGPEISPTFLAEGI